MPCPAKFSTRLLALGFTALTSTAAIGNEGRTVEVIKPQEQTTSIRPAAIGGNRFELGAYLGLLSVEDFNTNLVTGLTATYHINNQFLVQANYGLSSIDRATFEEISGGDFLADSDRDFEYQSLLAGYNLMQGRSFLGARRKFNSHLYLMAGAGRVSFAGQDNTGMVLGINYKTVLTPWLTLNLDFRDTIVDRTFLGQSKTTHNTELTLGLGALF